MFTALFFPAIPQGGIHSGTGGGASSLCAAVPSSGLQACYDSGSGLTCMGGCSNGNSVTQWNDQSSNANNLTCSSCGIYESSQINGNPAVRFDGAANFYSFGTSINLQTASTVFVVFKSASTGAEGCWVCGTSAGSIGYVYGSTVRGTTQVFFITSLQANGNAIPDTSWHQANYNYNATSLNLRINEAADAANPLSLTTAVTANETSVGYYAEYTTDYFNGDMASIIIYNTVLSAPNIATVEAVLNSKYGI